MNTKCNRCGARAVIRDSSGISCAACGWPYEDERGNLESGALCVKYGFRPWLGILPGFDWLSVHEHDLDKWQPKIVVYRKGEGVPCLIRN